MTRPDPDLALLRRVAGGDTDAFEALYDRRTPLLYAVARRIVRAPVDAEEVVRQAWVRAWQLAGDHDPQGGTVAVWLLGLVRSRALDALGQRAAGLRPGAGAPPEEHGSGPDAAAGAAVSPAQQRVRLALQRLDPHLRRVLESAYFDGLTQTQTAERLEAPLGTVKTWTRRGLLKLKELLPQEGAA